MRLICGLMRLDGNDADEVLLRAMAAQMVVPRLRPTFSAWQEGPTALGVLDFSVANGMALPLPQSSSLAMAADVRLDEPTSMPADMRLLSTVEQQGPDALDSVLGDFSFACWNRSAQILVCGRDAFGIRPFAYVYKPGELFAFASLPKALHGSGIVSKIIDEHALARRMLYRLRSDDSLIAGICRLPPAHYLEVSRSGIALKRYWQLDRAAVGTTRCPPEAAARELRRLVEQAVLCRLPPGGIGAHLSGGLDSSALAVLAARRLREEGRTLQAYSFLDRKRNDIALKDETEFVQAVLDQEAGIAWTAVRPPAGLERSPPLDADTMAPLDQDEPDNQVCAHAEEHGVGLILSGWGGDEAATFNGRGVLAEHLLRGRWRLFAREASALAKERGWSLPHILTREVLSYLLPDTVVARLKRAAGKKPDLAASLDAMLSAKVRRQLTDERIALVADGRENRWRLITSPHIAERAEMWAANGAHHGVAFAFPLLDRRVVEFALSLPSELFLRDGFRRRVFRDAMKGILPEKIRWRHHKYMAFPSSLIDLADNKDGFAARIDANAGNEGFCRLFDVARLRNLLDDFPSPEDIRKEMRGNDTPVTAGSMAAVAQALQGASYLEQHGGGADQGD